MQIPSYTHIQMCNDRPHCVTLFRETERQRLWFQLQTELSNLESVMKQNKVEFCSDYRRRAVGRVCPPFIAAVRVVSLVNLQDDFS